MRRTHTAVARPPTSGRPCVLQLIEGLREGGSEGQAVQLTRLLHESGRFRVRVACLNGDGVLRPEIEALGLGEIPEFRLTSFADANAARQLARLVRFIREVGVDVVHTHDFYTNIFGMAAARLSGVPVRVASRRETTGTRSPAQKLVERGAYRLSSAIVANAESVRAQLVREGVPDRTIVTIHNGVNGSRLEPRTNVGRSETMRALGLPWDDDRPVVSIVANLRLPVKDHPTFLRAARRVSAVEPRTAFVVAGEGPLLDETRALAERFGLGAMTHFTGRCDDVAGLLAVSDVCVLSSKAEGFSNAILEYMAAGRPVVATDVGGAREAVEEGETGYLVASGDDAAMAARITALVRDPSLRAAMGARGRRVVLERFTCAAQLASVERLYERLLAGSRAGTIREDEMSRERSERSPRGVRAATHE